MDWDMTPVVAMLTGRPADLRAPPGRMRTPEESVLSALGGREDPWWALDSRERPPKRGDKKKSTLKSGTQSDIYTKVKIGQTFKDQ